MYWPTIVILTIVGMPLLAAKGVETEPVDGANGAPASAMRAAFARPLAIPFPDDAPYDPEIATLGKMLFFDTRLSGAQNMSCASCHNPSFGWETPVEKAVGAANVPLSRHAPTVIDMAWVEPLFWDGRAATLEDQAVGPITAAAEMNATFPQVIARLDAVDGYARAFRKIFPTQGITRATILRALATYERTIVAGWSSFDHWVEGDETAISEAAKRGFALFVGRGRCVACHVGWNLTDNRFHDIGIATDDLGRAALDADDESARHAFKTPGLRNIAIRAPHMHNGSIADLEGVIRHYAAGGIARPSRAPEIAGFAASRRDIDDLIAFLETLTDDRAEVPTPILPAN